MQTAGGYDHLGEIASISPLDFHLRSILVVFLTCLVSVSSVSSAQTRPTLELSQVPPPSVLWGNLPNPADGQLRGRPFKCEGPPNPRRASKWPSLGHGTSLFFWDSVPEDDEEEGNQEWRDSGGMGGGRSGGGGGGGSL